MPTRSNRAKDPDVPIDHVRSLWEYNPGTGEFTWRVFRHPCSYPGDVAGYVAANRGNKSYVRMKCAGRLVFAHRLAWFYMTGAWPKREIDHINGDGLDNRWENLREADRFLNNRNLTGLKSNNTSGKTGVHFHAGMQRWVAHMRRNRQVVHCSYHQTRVAAIAAREQAQRDYEGKTEGPE